jgi:hypothetical protein
MKKLWITIVVLTLIGCTVALGQLPPIQGMPRGKNPIHPAYGLGLTKQQIVAFTLLGEARGEGPTGMYAVLCVIEQRALNRRLQPHQVCLQRWQFSCWNRGGTPVPMPILTSTPVGREAMRLASLPRALINRKVTNFADHYFAVGIPAPRWAKPHLFVIRHGRHLFYKLR